MKIKSFRVPIRLKIVSKLLQGKDGMLSASLCRGPTKARGNVSILSGVVMYDSRRSTAVDRLIFLGVCWGQTVEVWYGFN